jgi:phage tail-like protein
MASTRAVDPLVGFQFSLTVDDVTGYFTEVSGIGSENAVATHKVVNETAHEVTIQVPGRVEWGEITFKRGLTADDQFWLWREQVILGDTEGARRDVLIEMYDRAYVQVVSWTCVNAWPSKLSGPTIAADSNDFAIEELTIVHEGLYRDDLKTMIPAMAGEAAGG